MKEYLRQLIEGGADAITRNGLAREYLQARVLESLDWERARADVRPFLEREREIDLVSYETLKKLSVSA